MVDLFSYFNKSTLRFGIMQGAVIKNVYIIEINYLVYKL